MRCALPLIRPITVPSGQATTQALVPTQILGLKTGCNEAGSVRPAFSLSFRISWLLRDFLDLRI